MAQSRPKFARAEQGKAREEYYTTSKTEEFGLNKRTRRVARGDKATTTPDGKKYAASGEPTGAKLL